MTDLLTVVVTVVALAVVTVLVVETVRVFSPLLP